MSKDMTKEEKFIFEAQKQSQTMTEYERELTIKFINGTAELMHCAHYFYVKGAKYKNELLRYCIKHGLTGQNGVGYLRDRCGGSPFIFMNKIVNAIERRNKHKPLNKKDLVN